MADFTGQNIQDTFQRVIQIDGGALQDGTGSVILDQNELISLQAIGSSDITSTEWAEIAKIGTADISATEWGYVASMQSVSTAASPSFEYLRLTGEMGEDRYSILVPPRGGGSAPTMHISVNKTGGATPGVLFGSNGENIISFLDENGLEVANVSQAGVFGGTCNTATNATKIDVNDAGSIDSAYRITMVDHTGASYEQLYTDSALIYSPLRNSLSLGAITASGDISASGDLFSDNLTVKSTTTTDRLIVDQIDEKNTSSGIIITHNITASANISASATIIGQSYQLGDRKLVQPSLTDEKGLSFGNANDGNLELTHITASGEISASGKIHAPPGNSQGFCVDGKNALGGASDVLYLGNNSFWTQIQYGRDLADIHKFAGNVTVASYISASGQLNVGNIGSTNGHITASGNISSSGTITANKFKINNLEAIYENNGGYKFGQTPVPISVNHVTASGNISASGDLEVRHITASGNISSSGKFIADQISLGDTEVVTQTSNLHIRNQGSATTTIESMGNNNQIIEFKNNQLPDFAIGNYHTDAGFQIRSITTPAKIFMTIGANDGDVISISGSLNVTGSNGHITASGGISASGNVIAPKHINQVISIVQNSAYYNNVEGQYAVYVGNGTYGWNDRVWNKSYPLSGSDTMTNEFNSNANANCGVFVTHKLKNIRLVGTIKPSSNTPNPNTLAFYLYKLPSYSTTAAAGAAPQPVFIASASSADTAGTSFRTVFITGSVVNPSVGLDPGDSLIVGVNSSTTSGNIKFTYSVTGELDE
tara:strand:- start:7401 stop:9719 length:2319 start_codon:yes stop_codon:yes gene_type:complete